MLIGFIIHQAWRLVSCFGCNLNVFNESPWYVIAHSICRNKGMNMFFSISDRIYSSPSMNTSDMCLNIYTDSLLNESPCYEIVEYLGRYIIMHNELISSEAGGESFRLCTTILLIRDKKNWELVRMPPLNSLHWQESSIN